MVTLEKRREELDMIETYKVITGKSDVHPETWFSSAAAASGARVTRLAADPHNVRIPAARLELRKNFFSVRVCEKWNNLPQEVKNARTTGQFKTAYKRLMKNQA